MCNCEYPCPLDCRCRCHVERLPGEKPFRSEHLRGVPVNVQLQMIALFKSLPTRKP